MSLKKSIRTKILKAAAVGAVVMLERKLAKKSRRVGKAAGAAGKAASRAAGAAGGAVARTAARPVKRAAARVGDELAARREAREARATADEVVKMAKRIAKEQLQGGKTRSRKKKGLVAAAAGAVATAALRQGGRIAMAKLTAAATQRLAGPAVRPVKAKSRAARTTRPPRPSRGDLSEPLGI